MCETGLLDLTSLNFPVVDKHTEANFDCKKFGFPKRILYTCMQRRNRIETIVMQTAVSNIQKSTFEFLTCI